MASSFKELMKLWDNDLQNKIDVLVNNPNFVFFFKKGKDIFAATEESRIMFASMKNPDKDMPNGWENDANFLAYNLSKMVDNGRGHKEVISYKDLEDIKVLDLDKAAKELKR